MKKTYKESRLMYNNGSVVLYYFHKDLCKFPTGITCSKKDWDSKRNTLKTSAMDYEDNTKKLKDMLNWANDILKEKFKYDEVILKGSELKELLVRNYTAKEIAKSDRIVDHYLVFYKKKEKEHKDKPQSLKDYTSNKHLLEEFEIFNNRRVQLRSFNQQFLDELIEFSRAERPKQIELEDGSLYNYKTKGKMNNHTLKKRLHIFTEFYNFLVSQKLMPPNTFVRDTASAVNVVKNNKETLTIQEIHKLYKMDFKDKALNETKDLFIFICLTGLRWSDVEKFDSRFIKKHGDNWSYNTKPKKTEDSSGIKVYIPLCQVAKEILVRYNMDLRNIIKTNKTFNESIKIVCKNSGLFNEVTDVVNEDTGEYYHRYECITAHKGRDTFITNLIDVTPINELMKYTGHTKVSTLMGYVDKSREIKYDYVKVFDLP